MIITKISIQSSRTDRYNIYVDNQFSFSISANDLIEKSLAKGDQLSEKELKSLKLLSTKSLLKERALRYISTRPHSKFEVRDYLKRIIAKGKDFKKTNPKHNEKITNSIIKDLISKKYLNDKFFADWLVKQRLNSPKPRSKKAITAELYKKGIEKSIIDQVTKKISDESELKNAKKVAVKKITLLKKGKKNEAKLKEKLIRYLISKGYTWETIKVAVDSVLHRTYNDP